MALLHKTKRFYFQRQLAYREAFCHLAALEKKILKWEIKSTGIQTRNKMIVVSEPFNHLRPFLGMETLVMRDKY